MQLKGRVDVDVGVANAPNTQSKSFPLASTEMPPRAVRKLRNGRHISVETEECNKLHRIGLRSI